MRALLLIAVATTAIALSACGGKAGSAPTPAPTVAPTIAVPDRDLTDDQIASLTLSLDEYGPRYAGFLLDDSSGAVSLTERALEACIPSKEASSLTKYSWEKGYYRAFGPPDDTARPETLLVETNVDIYSNADSASAKLRYDAATASDDTRQSNGCFGWTIEGVTAFPVTGVGDEATGLSERFSLLGVRGSVSYVAFRSGRVIVMVGVARLTSEDSSAELIALAKKVDARLEPLLHAPLSRAPGAAAATGG